ncbi:MAG TPA: NADH-quinone oxidoreductase subunit N, partial [Alphaproteobacteria bacterium]|nr:NADH-quinone oxidoreductase subunit N [Alphaproteobacteria bacterium]
MNGPGLIAILPLIMLAAAAVAVMLAIAWRRHHGIAAGLTALSLVAALASLLPAAVVAPRQVT